MKRIFLTAVVLCAVVSVRAGDVVWSGGGTTGAWSEPANWIGGVPPDDGDTVVIPAATSAWMSSADISFATDRSLAGISLAAPDAALFITNETKMTLSVPLSGTGGLWISNGGKQLTLAADNGGFSGPVTLTNAYVSSDSSHKNFLGKDNVVTNYAGGSSSLVYFMCSGEYHNDWVVIGDAAKQPVAADYAIVCYASVEFKGSFFVRDSFNVNIPQSYCRITFSGGVRHEGRDGLCLVGNGKYEVSGDVPLISRCTNAYQAGVFNTFSSVFKLSAPVLGEPPRTSNNGHAVYPRIGGTGYLVCGGKNVINGGVAIQHGILNGTGGVRLDLNGYDQACGTMYRNSNVKITETSCCVTSGVPATLTMRGQWEYYGTSPGSDENTPLAFLGEASFEFWPTNLIRTGQSLTIMPKISLANTTWTTRGGLACRRGTVTLRSTTSMPNLRSVTVSHEGRLVVETDAVNPGGFTLAVTNVLPTTSSGRTHPLTIAEGVVLTADTAFVGRRWLPAGTYGGEEALAAGRIGASRVLDVIAGGGLLRVERYGGPCFRFFIR